MAEKNIYLGWSPRERPSLGPEAGRRAMEVTGEVGSNSALTVKVLETGGPPFVVVDMPT